MTPAVSRRLYQLITSVRCLSARVVGSVLLIVLHFSILFPWRALHQQVWKSTANNHRAQHVRRRSVRPLAGVWQPALIYAMPHVHRPEAARLVELARQKVTVAHENVTQIF